MILDTGIAIIMRPQSTAGIGNMAEQSSVEIHRGWYGRRTVSYNRYWVAQQAAARIDLVIRMLRPPVGVTVMPSDLVIAEGEWWRVAQASEIRDPDAGEDVIDLSLERIGKKYEPDT